jgi:hypothetical protein
VVYGARAVWKQCCWCCWSEGASVEWIRNNAAQSIKCSPARHFPDYAGDFCLARVGEVYQSRACVYGMRRASIYIYIWGINWKWCSWWWIMGMRWWWKERQPAPREERLRVSNERVGHEECAFERETARPTRGTRASTSTSKKRRAPTPLALLHSHLHCARLICAASLKCPWPRRFHASHPRTLFSIAMVFAAGHVLPPPSSC